MILAPWTLCLSVCTDEGHPLAPANRATIERLGRRSSRAAIATVATQSITMNDARSSAQWSLSFDGEPPCIERGELDADGAHLSALVRRARERSPRQRVVLWVVAHGHELGARVQRSTREGVRVTARRPFATMDLAPGASIETASLGRELAGASVDLLVLQSCAQGTVETLASLFENGAARRVIAAPALVSPPCDALDRWVDGVRADSTCEDVFDAVVNGMRSAIADSSNAPTGWASPREFELFLADGRRWSALSAALDHVARERAGDAHEPLSLWAQRSASRVSARSERVTLDELHARVARSCPSIAEELRSAMDAVFIRRASGGARSEARTATLVASSVIDRNSPEDFCERVGWFNAIAGLSLQHGVQE